MKMRRNDWIKKLSALAKVAKEKTDENIKIKQEKKRGRKPKEKVNKEGIVPCFDNCFKVVNIDDACKNSVSCKVNWFSVQQWFIEGILKNNKDWLLMDKDSITEDNQSWWAWPEKSCAERLLKLYGNDLVRDTVFWFCDNWQAMKDNSGGKLMGSPNVRFLWKCRDSIFADAKEGIKIGVTKRKRRKRHIVAEYDETVANKQPGIGWNDDV